MASKSVQTDMDYTGGARITGLSAPVDANEPVRKVDLETAIAGVESGSGYVTLPEAVGYAIIFG